MQLPFCKYQGTGNDFILIDNRDNAFSNIGTATIENLCHRRFGIGADGLMLLNKGEGRDFEMLYFNADGKPGSMCGNGGRCIVQFVYDLGIRKQEYLFTAPDGEHIARIKGDQVALKMNDVNEIQTYKSDHILDTGSPHYVQQDTNVMDLDVFAEGRKIRYSKAFAEKGINVNFVQEKEDDTILVRTYERGVEDETYSCGTGVTAAALVFYHNENGFNTIHIETKGGNLTVDYYRHPDGSYNQIWLTGPAKRVFTGTIDIIL